jgi:tRNA G18 (ribose-2'-O)-methylase SpoU
MSHIKLRTQPDMSLTSRAHQAAKEDVDGTYRVWERNITDNLKDKTHQEIKEHLKATAHPFGVCFEHWTGDFNLSTGIRNANAFNAKEVFYLGDKRWDKRGAVGVYNYTDVQWISTVEEFKKLAERYTIVGIDNVPGAVSLRSYHWPHNALMVFGEEGTGLTPEMLSLCQVVVEIPMFGSVRSLNCGTASGITMYDYHAKFEKYIWDNDE